ncbi:MAG TPA: efflux RND transporter permease subunit [Planctomycetota bacterium]|nr:efflux RND transporter permease subunit [Planctomycetota bacterium]
MNISDISIKRPIGVLVLTVMVAGLGLFFLSALSVDLLPRITYPMVRIVIDWKGASPEEVEENLTKKIEPSVATTEDAITVVSSSIEGNSSIEVYFEYGKDMDIALQDTRAKLDLVRRELPADADEPKIFKADPSNLPIIEIALFSATKDERDLRQWAENDLNNYFMGIPGLGSIAVSGGKIREIQVLFNQDQLRRYEISSDQISNALKAENVEFPAGRMIAGEKEYGVRLLAKFRDTEDIKNLILANREGRLIKVSDVAQVSDSYQEQRVLTRFNNQPCVMMSYFKQPNANTVGIVRQIEKRAGQLKEKGIIPADVNYTVASSQAYYITNSINNVGSSAVVGGLLAILAIWFFLHNIKRTLIIGIAVPVSILGTFILMGLSDLTLNIFSLGGLVIAVGMLVDNAVVMLENITRHQKDSPDPKAAAHNGSREVTGALIASTLTNMAAIIPFFLITGLSALLFRDFVITITVAIVISLLISLTVVPCLSAYIIKPADATNNNAWTMRLLDGLNLFYKRALAKALKYRKLVLGLALVLLVISIFLAKQVGREFLPPMDDGKVTVKLKMSVGTALDKTNQVTQKVEGIVKSMPGIEKTYTMAGGYWFRKNIYEKSNETEIQLQLLPKTKRPLATGEFIKRLQKKIKDESIPKAKIKVMRTPFKGIKTTSTSDIDIRVKGYDIDKLYGLAKEIQGKIRDVPGLENLDISVDFSKPELHVVLDRKKMSDFYLTARNISDALRAVVDGAVNTRFTDKQLDADYDIRLLADPLTLQSKESLENIILYPPNRAEVRLKEIGRVEISEGPVQIDRENQVRLVEITGDAIGKNVSQVTDEVKAKLNGLVLPPGYTLTYGGEAESTQESNKQLIIVVILAIFLVFVVMAVQYESLVDPLVIMLTLPLSLIGAIIFMAGTGTTFGATAFLGLILLVGIVVNNAIILVEYINILRRERGLDIYQAVLEAPPIRLRPILMTNLTTIIGLLPIVLGWGEGLEMLRPLAIVIIGGLGFGMLLTLFIIPCVYLTLHKAK